MTLLRIAAAVDLAASAGDGVRRVKILAYGGGVVSRAMGYAGDFVTDLGGMEWAKSFPLLAEHANALDAMAGSGTAEVVGGALYVAGTLSAPTEAAKKIIALLDSKTPLQASVGFEVLSTEMHKPGASITVNGRTIQAGPNGLQLVTKSRLREVSFVSIGADPNTSVIAASRGKESPMPEVIQAATPAATVNTSHGATAAELTAAMGESNGLLVRAMTEGWSVDRARTEGLAYEKAKLRTASIDNSQRTQFNTGAGKPTTNADHISAALMVRAGYSADAEKSFGASVMEQSRPLQSASLLDMCRAALVADGRDIPSDRSGMIKAALSTGSLPIALGSSADKILEATWRETPSTWREFAAIRNAPNLREQTSLRPTFAGDLELLPPGGNIKHGSFGENTFVWKAKTFAKMYTIDRAHLVNDDLSVFAELVPGLGKAALRTLNDLVYTVLLANAGSFFHANNANLVTGGTTNLSAASLEIAVKKLRIQRDPDGNDLDLQPAVLLVPPSLEVTARALLQSGEVSRIATGDNLPTGNVFKGIATLVVEPRLENSSFTGFSTTAWYLFASPADMPMVVGFLEGNQTPTIEQFGLDHDVNTLAASYRIFHDFGCALGDFRAAQKSAGA